mgnify:CR=1 FL=1
MDFLTLMNHLFTLKKSFPDMTISPEYSNWGESVVTVTLPVSDENAQLLLQAVQMFAE